jgi:hypothetical protein
MGFDIDVGVTDVGFDVFWKMKTMMVVATLSNATISAALYFIPFFCRLSGEAPFRFGNRLHQLFMIAVPSVPTRPRMATITASVMPNTSSDGIEKSLGGDNGWPVSGFTVPLVWLGYALDCITNCESKKTLVTCKLTRYNYV